MSRDIKRLIGEESYLERGWVIRQKPEVWLPALNLLDQAARVIMHEKVLEDHGKR